jgi:hypothetical protein
MQRKRQLRRFNRRSRRGRIGSDHWTCRTTTTTTTSTTRVIIIIISIRGSSRSSRRGRSQIKVPFFMDGLLGSNGRSGCRSRSSDGRIHAPERLFGGRLHALPFECRQMGDGQRAPLGRAVAFETHFVVFGGRLRLGFGWRRSQQFRWPQQRTRCIHTKHDADVGLLLPFDGTHLGIKGIKGMIKDEWLPSNNRD